jgi:hypothetical protein
MDFMLQILTQKQGAEVVELLRPPYLAARADRERAEISVVRGGARQLVEDTGIDSLITRLHGDWFHEVRLDFSRLPSDRRREDIPWPVAAVLSISPTNTLWLPVSAAPRVDPEDASGRRSLASLESSLKWNGVESAPTVLAVDVAAEVEPASTGWLEFFQVLFNEETLAVEPFGWVDYDSLGTHVFTQLAPWPRALSLLGSKLDALHPIMFGSRALCDEIAAALGPELVPLRYTVSAGRRSIEMVFLSREELGKYEGRPFHFLVPRDITTEARGADASSGEYEVKGSVFLTRKRRRDLARTGVPIEPRADYEPMLVVDEELCRMAGIDPDEFIEIDVHRRNRLAIQQQIKSSFDALDASLPLQERIWQAHREAYGGWLGGLGFFGQATPEILELIHLRLR